SDAHNQGLEVYASGFANDLFSSYDYNYDPTAEYLQFIAKDVSIDGLVIDFPSTASNFIELQLHIWIGFHACKKEKQQILINQSVTYVDQMTLLHGSALLINYKEKLQKPKKQ
ncbi:hypothetical protein RYX36_004596, partial [Vicia faba]